MPTNNLNQFARNGLDIFLKTDVWILGSKFQRQVNRIQGMNIRGTMGLTNAQKITLKALGAIGL
ncbi:MAG TPA: hypothetical protein V6C91_14415 [Coleofasciculaceae cyanobacterium]